MHRQFYTDTVGPGSKHHLDFTTAFACTVRWSLKPGFTVHDCSMQSSKRKGNTTNDVTCTVTSSQVPSLVSGEKRLDQLCRFVSKGGDRCDAEDVVRVRAHVDVT